MAKKKTKIVIWLLAGSCLLNLIFAVNAGQKRKVAERKLYVVDAKCVETDLRYKNAIQSYESLERDLKEARKDLEEQKIFTESLKEALQEEQKKSALLRQEFDKRKAAPPSFNAESEAVKQQVQVKQPEVVKKQAPVRGAAVKPQTKKADRSSGRW